MWALKKPMRSQPNAHMGGSNWTHETWVSGGVPIHVYQNYANGNLKRLSEGALRASGPPVGDGNFSVQMIVPSFAEAGLVRVSTLAGSGYDPSAGFTITDASSSMSATLTVDRAFTTDGTTSEQSAFKLG
jgi:hypothetical protein